MNSETEFLMSVFLTLLVLTSWIVFIWISDPDGFREAFARRRPPIPVKLKK